MRYENDHDKKEERRKEEEAMKRVIRIPKEDFVTVEDCYEQLPLGGIKIDKDGRKREVKVPLVSCNGKHVVCRDIGSTTKRMCWDDYPVEKITFSEFEIKIYLRRKKKACA